jgi:putative flippase GtrA
MISKRFIRFSIFGIVGFLADSSILYLMLSFGSSPMTSRLISFLCAVFVTWQLNRRMTFDAPRQQSLMREGVSYLLAMSIGGAFNLMTYFAVIRSLPDQVWVPALGVAMGSIVGLMMNYLIATNWVFAVKADSWGVDQLTHREQTWVIVAVLQIIFWVGALHAVELPGLYMDAVNPDYLSARTLHPEIRNAVNAMPTVWFPMLGSLYHGVQNYYVSLPVVGLLGFNLPALRIAQALFGAGIVTMMYFVTQRIVSSRLLAFAAAALLATDIAFLASFRTQFYIVISGVFWLLFAIYVALGTKYEDNLKQRFFISGALYGLAVYSYFIFLFFLPVWLVLIRYNTARWQPTLRWTFGFCLGMSPYVLGYLSLMFALGGPRQFVDWLIRNFSTLAPLSSKLTFQESVSDSLRNASYAIQNTGNELMIFGNSLNTPFTEFKVWWLIVGTLLLLVPFKILKDGRSKSDTYDTIEADDYLLLPHQLVWFALAFMLFSLTLGNRIWIHHFSILVPLLYLLAISGFSFILGKHFKILLLAMIFSIGSLNVYQQDRFFDQLELTGGTGKMSNAQARLVEDALASPVNTVYFFPEWGFFMPFAFLTGNQKPYELDVSAETLQKHKYEGNLIRLAFWSANDEVKYQEILNAQGFRKQEVVRYIQRDQKPAFFVIHAAAP